MADTYPLRHVGVIMDGNRRWAQAHGVTTLEGHRAGYEALMALLPVITQLRIPYVTVYTFSAENWQRAQEEVKGLMKLLKWIAHHKLKVFVRENIRLRWVGSREGVPADIVTVFDTVEAATAHCSGTTLSIAFNYGGQQEIVDAARQLIKDEVPTGEITPNHIAERLYAPEIPDIDLLIRTSGEQRLSGFMLWRTTYAEIYVTDTLWPDFDKAALLAAIDVYTTRKRRFGA